MTNDEAKFILSAYRPGGHDAADPAFAEALDQARKDPALARWFEFERRFDEVMTAKIGAVTPPAGLRDAILAGARVTGKAARPPCFSPSAWRFSGRRGWMRGNCGSSSSRTSVARVTTATVPATTRCRRSSGIRRGRSAPA
jgi:hypothetical protein